MLLWFVGVTPKTCVVISHLMAFLEELCGATVCEDGSGPRFSRKTRCRSCFTGGVYQKFLAKEGILNLDGLSPDLRRKVMRCWAGLSL
ncbi:hypothetical protein F2Q69_00012496 [Brassica cretica]|uniref:Secreted protein n=1 Tax=Brassica cretica TaxID=69181 RepID=A0A8S9R4N1_BRACR|nr:hypothetical protein F2Q69_00012496 [Brassica cretica]